MTLMCVPWSQTSSPPSLLLNHLTRERHNGGWKTTFECASVVLWNRHAQAGKSPGLKLCHLLHVKAKSYLQRSHPSFSAALSCSVVSHQSTHLPVLFQRRSQGAETFSQNSRESRNNIAFDYLTNTVEKGRI